MNTIKIVTFHTPMNYGAVLQAFGLLESTSQLASEVSIVDYDTDHLREIYSILKKPNNLKSFVAFALMLPHYWSIRRKYAKFDEFKASHLKLTKLFDSFSQLEDEKWDAGTVFCTGSDQVFNPSRIDEERKVFYLDFVPEECSRVSYAASFGVTSIPVERIEEVKGYLSKFRCLSVREVSGAQLVRQLVDIDAPVVLDPVFLCPKERWEEISLAYHRQFTNYLLYYKILSNHKNDDFAHRVAKEKNLKLVTVTQSLVLSLSGTVLYDVGPQEFLGLLRGASFVITDAFHGVAMSIIMKKQFVFSDVGVTNNRGIELLRMLHIERQCYCETYDADSFIDYKKVDGILSSEIQESLEFLKSAIA